MNIVKGLILVGGLIACGVVPECARFLTCKGLNHLDATKGKEKKKENDEE